VGRALGRRGEGHERGTVTIEYVALLALVSVAMTLALTVVVRRLVATHDVIQERCSLPFP
jgi:Flp pilus assembly pilin Flp